MRVGIEIQLNGFGEMDPVISPDLPQYNSSQMSW